MRFNKQNAAAIELFKKLRPVRAKPTLFGYQQKTLATGMLTVLVVLLIFF
ncbi:hypothetical protein [Aquitalea palustris]|nr:hypothetical protein [Aquitalea palustris]